VPYVIDAGTVRLGSGSRLGPLPPNAGPRRR